MLRGDTDFERKKRICFRIILVYNFCIIVKVIQNNEHSEVESVRKTCDRLFECMSVGAGILCMQLVDLVYV